MTRYPIKWTPAPQTIYIGLADLWNDGLYHQVDYTLPANANTPAKRMAYVADCALSVSDDRPFKLHALTIAGGVIQSYEDVTDEAISCLVDCLRNPPSPTLRLDAGLGYLPFWFERHDQSLTAQEIDINADAEAV